jgi:membrane fusion protein (multidrug efflux system)
VSSTQNTDDTPLKTSEPGEVRPDGNGQHKRKHASDSGQSAWRNPRNLTLGGLVLAILLMLGIYHLVVASRYESTDDAYMAADVVQVASQVSGSVKQVLVEDNQQVKAGDLLVVLDDAPYRATVAQRQADLDAAIAQAKGAGVNVELVSEQGNAQLTQAAGGVEQADSGIAGARAEVDQRGSAAKNAAATARSFEANVGAAESAVNAAIANKKRYAESVNAAEAQVESSNAAVKTADSNVDAAKAIYERSARDAERYAALSKQGAASKQRLEEAESSAEASKAQLEGAREQVVSAKAVVLQKHADFNAAKQQLEAADAAIAQARSQLAAAKEQSVAASEAVNQAQAQRNVAVQSVRQAQARKHTAVGQLGQARTVTRQVGMSLSAREQAMAKVEQARAALETARLQLSYTRIYAPSSGRTNKKDVEVGALVQPGTPLMAVVKSGTPWVAANFKETQLSGVRPGCPAEVRVDAFPGRVFKAHVKSVSPATGSIFALLPADNATGNFTKVVQRMPVKIVLDSGQQGEDRLSAGMSVVARVKKG